MSNCCILNFLVGDTWLGRFKLPWLRVISVMTVLLGYGLTGLAQSPREPPGAADAQRLGDRKTQLRIRKLERTVPPRFESGAFEGIFFEDVRAALSGSIPSSSSSIADKSRDRSRSEAELPLGSDSTASAEADMLSWKNLITPSTLEDLVKGSKLRLDRIVTTPASFAGGGFNEARKEFSLLSLAFAIIESYPGDVRWKSSAAEARSALMRTAANTKVGSRQVFDESKKRLHDLEELMSGSGWAAEVAADLAWERLIDIDSLMKLLELAFEQQISKLTADEALLQRDDNMERVLQNAELVAILGRVASMPGMPNADDSQYRLLTHSMIQHAAQIRLAVRTNNAQLARSASAKLGQCCTDCHSSYR